VIAVIGGNSQLGQCFVSLASFPLEIFYSNNLNLLQYSKIRENLKSNQSRYLINFAAYNDVESAESSKETNIINYIAVKELAMHCAETNKILINISSDYVFDGLKGNYIESDPTNPINKYGESKMLGEQAIQEHAEEYIIIRTSWLYSHLPTKNNFLNKLKPMLLKNNQTFSGANDVYASPTSALSLAEALLHMIQHISTKDQSYKKIYHFCDRGRISRFKFLVELNKLFNLKFNLSNSVVPVSNSFFNLNASRPADTSLNAELFDQNFDYKRAKWDTALQNIINKI